MAIMATAFLAILCTGFVYLLPLILWIIHVKMSKGDMEYFLFFYFLSALGWLAVFLLKKFVTCVQTCLELTKYQRNRNNILIGLGFIALCSIVGRIVFYDSEKLEKTDILIILYLLATSFASFYFIFVEGPASKCKWNFKFSGYQFGCLCGAVTVNLLAILLVFIAAVRNQERSDIIIICFQIASGLIGTTSSIEILMILMGKLEMDEQNREELTTVTTEKPKEATKTLSIGNDRVYVM
ncbi:hypothetical protein CAEBREN_25083 [Caenorhabditis brenneri]|uniref:Uncharacterized protein n=1 Tax=Caenorhabditis brenneri TaxID=135651 RepID=G0MWS7_CAEBE|nr:hypothetical protein CAEBREN_25083 [Caenorhabditis brenneri]